MEIPSRLKESLAEGTPLSKRLAEAPVGWIEALAVQVPEQFGVELLDAAQWELGSFRREAVGRKRSCGASRHAGPLP